VVDLGGNMTIRAVIFDFGGVIARTTDYTSRDDLAARLGMTRHELEKLVFMGESGLNAQRGVIGIDQHWTNLRDMLHLSPEGIVAFQNEFWGGDSIDRDLVDYIRSLKKRYRTGLLSNAFSDLREMLVRRWKIADAFDEIVISSEVGVTKPDPRIYYIALERFGTDPGEAVFVDDFLHNVEGARSAGMYAIHFRDPDQATLELQHLF
jgi:HAD superfamily hydrolase (TIGR01509 family)